MKKINLLAVFIFLSLLFLPNISKTQSANQVYFFYANGCPHCAKEELFLDKIAPSYPNIVINRLEVTSSKENANLLMDFGKKLQADVSGVPFTVVGDNYFIGYFNEQTTGAQIEQAISQLNSRAVIVVPRPLPIQMKEEMSAVDQIPEPTVENKNGLFDVPGINLDNMSLLGMSVALGFLDGFNPCAMWALVFLITLLLGMENKKKMWALGLTFIAVSAFVYFLFMVAWLNLILFLAYVIFIRILIGLLALGGGIYNIKEFYTNKAGTCKVSGGEKKKKIFNRLKEIVGQKSFVLSLMGIIILAFAVNLVELICSAGLPAVYTQILALNDLSTWQYYSYILVYIFFFMIDDMLVFFVAMTTLQLTGLSTKYSRWSSLIGGTIMVIIGILLIFKPDILMFG
ncbi:hypothetical protein KKH39_00665 [Patescibacteria group bacterium]|nr:hypothetical protein [Patescibacteria group bacterium]